MIDPVTATLALLRGDASLTALTLADARKGIYVADELPEGIATQETTPRCVVIQLAPEESVVGQIVAARTITRLYAPSFVDSMRMYHALWRIVHDDTHESRGPRRVVRWMLRGARLTAPRQGTEPDGWKVTTTDLITRWNNKEYL